MPSLGSAQAEVSACLVHLMAGKKKVTEPTLMKKVNAMRRKCAYENKCRCRFDISKQRFKTQKPTCTLASFLVGLSMT